MMTAVAHCYPRHGGQPRACGARGSVSPELPLTADAALAGCQHEPDGYVSSPIRLASLDLAGRFGARSFSRDEFVDRRGSGPPTRTVAIGGRERILVRSARLQSPHDARDFVVLGALFAGIAERLRQIDPDFHRNDAASLLDAARVLGATHSALAHEPETGLTPAPDEGDG